MKSNPNILVCPLDWGIGHATRCVPVIQELLFQNANVIVAADGRSLAFLQLEFPDLIFINFPGYKFSYPEKGSMTLKMAMQIPSIIKGIRREKRVLKEILKNHNIDGVISDNRYGLFTKNVCCIFITHQLKIKVPQFLFFLRPLLNRINIHYISKFNECWIPDFEDEPNLSGELSHLESKPSRTYFIGPLSRFAEMNEEDDFQNKNEIYKYDFLVLLSGPEPQRTILEEKILSQLRLKNYSAMVISGKPESRQDIDIDCRLKVYPHLNSEKLRRAILESRMVISRSGYSTLMDLTTIGKKAIFVPTPGQTEQEYLAEYCSNKNWFYSMNQQNIDLEEASVKAENFTGFKRIKDQNLLKKRISVFLKSVQN